MKLQFIICSDHKNLENRHPIMIQLEVNNKILILNTPVVIEETSWDRSRQKIIASDLHSLEMNLILTKMETRIYEYYNDCLHKLTQPDIPDLIKIINAFNVPTPVSNSIIGLTEDQLENIEKEVFKGNTKIISEIFRFICYTGMPYKYARKIKQRQQRLINSQQCIVRTAETPFSFPFRLTREASMLINKWKQGNEATTELILPAISKTTVDEGFKTIGDAIKYPGKLHWEMAEKTYWDTFILKK